MTSLSKVVALLFFTTNLHVTVAGPTVSKMSCTQPLLQFLGAERNCCPATGRCQDSSCTVFGYASSEKSNCPGKNRDCNILTCKYDVAGCSGTGTGQNAQHCYGKVACKNGPGTCQSDSLGLICLEDGSSDNFKICGETDFDDQSQSKCQCDDKYRTTECLKEENDHVEWEAANVPNCDFDTLFESLKDTYDCTRAACGGTSMYCNKNIPPEAQAKFTKCQEYIKTLTDISAIRPN